MKPLFILCVLFILSATAPAQTARAKSDLRTVDGKIYNALTAPGWETIPAESDETCIVAKVLPEGIACDIQYFHYTTALGSSQGHEKYILVKNHPRQASAVTGDALNPFRAVPVSRAQLFGGTVVLYDYGTPYQPPPPPPPTASEKLAAQILAENRKTAADLATFKFHHERALAGDETSQRRLAQLYLTGTGCEKDTNTAAAWLRAAATNAPPR
jgi:TPR repeat protein